MASETMTVQEAIEVIDDLLSYQDGGAKSTIALRVLLAHARATTAGTGAGVGTVRDAIAEAYWSWRRSRVMVNAPERMRDATEGMQKECYELADCITAALAASARGA